MLKLSLVTFRINTALKAIIAAELSQNKEKATKSFRFKLSSNWDFQDNI
jgi:hypothetical protein